MRSFAATASYLPGTMRLTSSAFRRIICWSCLMAGPIAAQPNEPRPYWRDRGPEIVNGFSFCRLRYRSVRHEADGHGWGTDYPQADRHLMIRLGELTSARIAVDGKGEPSHYSVDPADPDLAGCPFIMSTDVGTMELSEPEVAGLRAYLLKGGFWWVDDFWGSTAWEYWAAEVARVFPELEIVDVPVGHLILPVAAPQISNRDRWRSTGNHNERGEDSAEVHVRGVFDASGRLMIFMTHNTDIGDSWERETDPDFFAETAFLGYPFGINVLLYAMSH